VQIKEIIALESNNTSNTILFREGIFWRAYKRSAYYFVTLKKSLIPSLRFKHIE
jgi:hypothetical protein